MMKMMTTTMPMIVIMMMKMTIMTVSIVSLIYPHPKHVVIVIT